MTEKSPKKGIPAPDPQRRTLSSAEIAVGQCAGSTRDRLDEVLAAEEVLPTLASDLGIDDELQNAFDFNVQDSFLIAKAKEDLKKEELDATKKEVAGLEIKIIDATTGFKAIFQNIKEAKVKVAESKKMSRKANIGPNDHLEALKNVKMAKDAIKRLDQLKLEFEMWIKRLQAISKGSKVLKNPEVVRLAVLFQKMDNAHKR